MKKIVKIFCLVMALTLTLPSLPITALAVQLAPNEKIDNATKDISQNISEDVYVMAEATEKRGEFEKHYILSDGSMVAVSYPEAIHYISESGKWEDVDNTFSYDSKSKRYVGGKGNTKVSFTESVSSGALVAIKDNHGTMEWSLGIIRNNKAEKSKLSSTNAKVGEKNITPKTTNSLKEADTFDLPKTVGKIQYATLFTNAPEISVDYSVYHNKIEEDIYINSPTDLTSFTMDVQIGDLIGVVNKDGSVEFKNESGEVIYRIGVPYMHDSADSVLNDIVVTLTQIGDTCIVAYTPNSEWLNSEDREYPILFDPSITTSEYNSNITDTYVMQGDIANHSYQQTMYVGVKSGSVCRTYIKINTLPAIDLSMPILSATMTLSLWASSSSGKTVGIYKANSSWSADTITYATQPYSTQLATCAFNASDLHYTFNLSNDVSEVYDEFLAGVNHGYMLRYIDESTINPDYNSIYSTEYTTKSYRPVLKIVYGYALPDSIREGGIYSFQNVGSMGVATVYDSIDADATNVVQEINNIENIMDKQKFKLEYVPSRGGYIFRALCSSAGSNRVLDISKDNGYVEDGCNVQIYQNNDPIAQEWLIIGVNYLKFRIVPRTNMSLSLSVNGSSNNGTDIGVTPTAIGNVYVASYTGESEYQHWYIIENGDYVTFDDDQYLENTTYYVNNYHYGQYLFNDTETNEISVISGQIFYLGDSIRWKFTYVGNGKYAIQSVSEQNKFLGRLNDQTLDFVTCYYENNLPDNCLWEVEQSIQGGVHIYFVKGITPYYLRQNDSGLVLSSAKGTIGSVCLRETTWRIVDTSYLGSINGKYTTTDLKSPFTIDNMRIDVGETLYPTINAFPSNAIWTSPSDFIYSYENTTFFYEDFVTKEFTGLSRGPSLEVVATHKVTNLSTTFTVTVNSNWNVFFDQMSDLYDAAYTYNAGNQEKAIESTFNFICGQKYNSGMWGGVIGGWNDNFVDYIQNNYISLYNYFMCDSTKLTDQNYIITLIDPSTLDNIDVLHMCATLNRLFYTGTTVFNGINTFGLLDEHVDNLCGWAGDFQALIRDYFEAGNDYSTESDVYNAFYPMIGDDYYFCSYSDIISDIDACHLSDLLKSGNITNGSDFKAILLQYYFDDSGKVSSKRFTYWIGDLSDSELQEKISVYCNDYSSIFGIKWPLLDSYSIYAYQEAAFTNAFVDYLRNQELCEQ